LQDSVAGFGTLGRRTAQFVLNNEVTEEQVFSILRVEPGGNLSVTIKGFCIACRFEICVLD
jgi:hypothetical protein